MLMEWMGKEFGPTLQGWAYFCSVMSVETAGQLLGVAVL